MLSTWYRYNERFDPTQNLLSSHLKRFGPLGIRNNFQKNCLLGYHKPLPISFVIPFREFSSFCRNNLGITCSGFFQDNIVSKVCKFCWICIRVDNKIGFDLTILYFVSKKLDAWLRSSAEDGRSRAAEPEINKAPFSFHASKNIHPIHQTRSKNFQRIDLSSYECEPGRQHPIRRRRQQHSFDERIPPPCSLLPTEPQKQFRRGWGSLNRVFSTWISPSSSGACAWASAFASYATLLSSFSAATRVRQT